jgi:hypothetical protein
MVSCAKEILKESIYHVSKLDKNGEQEKDKDSLIDYESNYNCKISGQKLVRRS